MTLGSKICHDLDARYDFSHLEIRCHRNQDSAPHLPSQGSQVRLSAGPTGDACQSTGDSGDPRRGGGGWKFWGVGETGRPAGQFPKFQKFLGGSGLHHFWKQPGDEMAISFRILLWHIDLMHLFMCCWFLDSSPPAAPSSPPDHSRTFIHFCLLYVPFCPCSALMFGSIFFWVKNSFFSSTNPEAQQEFGEVKGVKLWCGTWSWYVIGDLFPLQLCVFWNWSKKFLHFLVKLKLWHQKGSSGLSPKMDVFFLFFQAKMILDT